jgi:hypothetical protein
MKYKVTVSKTAQGDQDYLQILSPDGFEVNIVLIGEIDLEDTRTEPVKSVGYSGFAERMGQETIGEGEWIGKVDLLDTFPLSASLPKPGSIFTKDGSEWRVESLVMDSGHVKVYGTLEKIGG